MRAPQHRYTFPILIATQTLSLIGSRLTSVGVGIWLFQSTGSAAPLLLSAFFNELPGMLAGSLAGVAIDRWDRRAVLLLADLGQAVGSLFLLLSIWSGLFQVWHLYTVAFWQGCFAMFQQPAQDAVMTLLVPEPQRDRANGVRQMAFPLAGVIAPALAGILFLSIGVAGIILIDLATFLLAVIVLAWIHIPRPPASDEAGRWQGHWLRELAGGFRYLAGQRPLFLFFVLYLTLVNFLLNGPLELAIPYLLLRTGSEKIAGSLLGGMSLGALIGAALVAVLGASRQKMRVMLAGYLFCGVMFLVYGTASPAWVLGLALLLLAVPLPVGGALSTSLLQAKTHADFQGRIFGSLSQLALLGSTSSFLITGWLVDYVLEPAARQPGWAVWAPLVGRAPGAGMGLLLMITGLVMIVATVAVAVVPAVRDMEASLPDQNLP